MRDLSQPSGARTKGFSLAGKVCVLFLLGAFTLQLGRVFIYFETCAHHRSTGYTLQHCKDSVSALTPAPVMAKIIPPAGPLPILEPRWGHFHYRLDTREDAPLAPLFHPPRKSA